MCALHSASRRQTLPLADTHPLHPAHLHPGIIVFCSPLHSGLVSVITLSKQTGCVLSCCCQALRMTTKQTSGTTLEPILCHTCSRIIHCALHLSQPNLQSAYLAHSGTNTSVHTARLTSCCQQVSHHSHHHRKLTLVLALRGHVQWYLPLLPLSTQHTHHLGQQFRCNRRSQSV